MEITEISQKGQAINIPIWAPYLTETALTVMSTDIFAPMSIISYEGQFKRLYVIVISFGK